MSNPIKRFFKRLRKSSVPSATTPPEDQQLIAAAKKLQTSWHLSEALQKVDAALAIKPRLAKALQLRVEILGSLGQIDEARDSAKLLVQIDPLSTTTLRLAKSLGVAIPEASAEYAYEILMASNYRPSVATQAIEYLHYNGMFEAALDFLDLGIVSVAMDSNKAKQQARVNALLNLKAISLEGLERFDEALPIHMQLVLDSSMSSRASHAAARCWLEMGRPQMAEDILRITNKAAKDPNPFSGLMLDTLQAQGKLLESYQLYRKRPVSAAIAKQFNSPGKPDEIRLTSSAYKDKTVLIVSEGGPGDELRLSAVYPDLSARCGELTITCEPRLESMLVRTFPHIKFLPVDRHRREIVREMAARNLLVDRTLSTCLSDRAIEVGQKSDFGCSLLDTLADLRPSKDAFGPRVAFQPLPLLREKWAGAMAPNKLRIGIAWRSMLLSVARNRHYISAEDLSPLAQIPNAEFWLLQPTATEEELETLRGSIDLKVPDGLDLVNDFEGQLALVANLDWVLSPFTTTGELSGAAGVPTILFSLTANTAWRRTDNGTDIWAPSTIIAKGDRKTTVQAAIKTILNQPTRNVGSAAATATSLRWP